MRQLKLFQFFLILLFLAAISLIFFYFKRPQPQKICPQIKPTICETKKPKKQELKNTNEPLNLNFNFIIPTAKRKNVGYKYLQRTIDSIHKTFKVYPNVKIHTFLFGYEEYNHPNYYLLKKPKKEIKNSKTRHTTQILEMMKMWKGMCSANNQKMFILMEDDFEMCENSINHWMFVYAWANKYFNKWRTIRTSIGLNGLIIPCDGIPEIIRGLTELIETKPQYPHDSYLIFLWKNQYPNYKRDVTSHTYRYNMFVHIGSESLVDNGGHRSIPCMSLIRTYFLDRIDHYDDDFCGAFPLSPCGDTKLQIPYMLNFENKMSFPGDLEMKLKLMNELQVKIIPKKYQNITCETFCRQQNGKCHDNLFAFANSKLIVSHFFPLITLYDIGGNIRMPERRVKQVANYLVDKPETLKCKTMYKHEPYDQICPCVMNKKKK